MKRMTSVRNQCLNLQCFTTVTGNGFKCFTTEYQLPHVNDLEKLDRKSGNLYSRRAYLSVFKYFWMEN